MMKELPDVELPLPVDSSVFKSASTTKLTILPNGLRVASQQPYGRAVAFNICVDAGYMYESVDNVGVSRLLEKMTFQVRL
jgi:processing peptidase subunit alpha